MDTVQQGEIASAGFFLQETVERADQHAHIPAYVLESDLFRVMLLQVFEQAGELEVVSLW